jgi:outer membrane protein
MCRISIKEALNMSHKKDKLHRIKTIHNKLPTAPCSTAKSLRNAITLLLLGGLAISAAGRAVQADDLLSVYKLAMESDPKIRAAAAARDAALEVIPQSKAVLLPSIGINADVTRDRYDPRNDYTTSIFGTPVPTETTYYTNETYTLELRQAVFRRDRFMQLKQADHQAAQAEAIYDAARDDLILRVATSYFLVLAAQDNLDFVVADKEAIAETLKQATQRYDVGLAAITDVVEAQARYDIAVSDELNAEKLLDDAREAMYKLTGTELQALDVLREQIPLILPEPEDPEKWTATALEQNPQLLAAQAKASAAKDQIEVQRSGHYPTLDMIARYLYRDNDFGGTGNTIKRDDSAIGLQMNLPIYQGGLISSQTRQASYQYAQAHEDQIDQLREVRLQTRDSYRGVVVEISKVKALKQAILSGEKALSASEAGFEAGTRTIVDVLDSQRELLRARRDHARSRYDYLLNTLRLKQAAGIVDDTDIVKINALLE